MISSIFYTILYEPFYNGLVLLSGFVPGGDIGLAVITLTIIVRLILTPLTHRQIHTQRKMKLVEGELAGIRKKYETDKQEQTRQMMELYKKHGINPFSGFLLIFIQIPILLALYYVFSRGIPFSSDHLYNFVSLPAITNFKFLGFFDLTAKNYILAILVGVSQYFQIRLSMPPTPVSTGGDKSFSQELAKSMSTNMRYVMPVMIAVIAAGFPSVISLYWLTSNLFAIGHELIVRQKAKSLISPSLLKPP
ncbi:MAG TPA: YidC/Oxa1 family membrane protein insertase [Candidatus Paceibacterota bacterium]